MADSLIPISISAPGFYGLNLQDSPVDLPSQFCLGADNCIIDQGGRIGARKGWAKVNATNSSIDTSSVSAIHEYIDDAGATTQLFVCNKNIWTLNTSTGAVASIYNDATWTDDNWKAVNFNDKCYFFQRSHDPLVYNGTTLTKVSAAAGYTGSVVQANEVLAAYGRLWTADTATDKKTIKWSDTLIGEAWTGGASGSVNIDTVLSGTRPITALAAFNGFLVIFCDKAIVIYDGADDDPNTNLVLQDVILGTGCIARDAVCNVGDDIFFLSDSGVRSLSRVIQEKSTPINDVGRNVKDDIISNISAQTDVSAIKAVYHETEGFFLVTLPAASTTYCFDTKNRLEGGVCRVTKWDLTPNCYNVTKSNKLYMGFTGAVGYYSTYLDNAATYNWTYTTSHLTGSEDVAELLKILKSLQVVFRGGSGYTVTFIIGYNYQDLTHVITKVIPSSGTAAEWGVAEYGEDEYGSVLYIPILRTPTAGQGRVFQISMTITINQKAVSVQQLTNFVKKGRLAYV